LLDFFKSKISKVKCANGGEAHAAN